MHIGPSGPWHHPRIIPSSQHWHSTGLDSRAFFVVIAEMKTVALVQAYSEALDSSQFVMEWIFLKICRKQ